MKHERNEQRIVSYSVKTSTDKRRQRLFCRLYYSCSRITSDLGKRQLESYNQKSQDSNADLISFIHRQITCRQSMDVSFIYQLFHSYISSKDYSLVYPSYAVIDLCNLHLSASLLSLLFIVIPFLDSTAHQVSLHPIVYYLRNCQSTEVLLRNHAMSAYQQLFFLNCHHSVVLII